MKMESFPTCMICGQTGRIRYTDLPDRLFGVSGRFQFRECPWCQLLWIDPRPSLESISECYLDYYTHERIGSGGEPVRPLAALRDRLREAILCGYFGYGTCTGTTGCAGLAAFWAGSTCFGTGPSSTIWRNGSPSLRIDRTICSLMWGVAAGTFWHG